MLKKMLCIAAIGAALVVASATQAAEKFAPFDKAKIAAYAKEKAPPQGVRPQDELINIGNLGKVELSFITGVDSQSAWSPGSGTQVSVMASPAFLPCFRVIGSKAYFRCEMSVLTQLVDKTATAHWRAADDTLSVVTKTGGDSFAQSVDYMKALGFSYGPRHKALIASHTIDGIDALGKANLLTDGVNQQQAGAPA
jgi:hypothetical protein